MEISKNFTDFISKNPHVSFISNLNKMIDKMGLTMVYEGKIDQDVIKYISKSIETKLDEEEPNFKIKRLIFHIVIELLQNISKYSDDEIQGKGIIIIGKSPDGYYVSSGNNINSNKKEFITNCIEKINSSTKEELNEIYQIKMVDGKFNSKAGAGLGFIDIVRKSNQKILYNFEKINSSTSFFLVTISILK